LVFFMAGEADLPREEDGFAFADDGDADLRAREPDAGAARAVPPPFAAVLPDFLAAAPFDFLAVAPLFAEPPLPAASALRAGDARVDFAYAIS
jgi:hypothetical protein